MRLLGGLAIAGLDDRSLGSRKARQLVKALALARGRPVPVEGLIEVLWRDQPPQRPVDQLGVLVSRVRAVVGPDRLLRTDAGYALRTDWLDVEELADRVTEAAAACADGRLGAGLAAAQAALALARGSLLPEEDGAWVEAERARCASLLGRAHQLAAELGLSMGDHSGAAAAAEAGLGVDPYDEVSLRLLMRAHRAAGRPASGLAAYLRVREQLAEDLGVPPSPETESLHDELVLGVPGPGATRGHVAAPRSRTLVGRDDELAELDAALGRASAGDPTPVIVVGEAGIGKTALVERWVERLSSGVLVVSGRCDPLGRDLPLQPVADAAARHLRALGPLAAASVLGEHADVLEVLLGHRSAAGVLTNATDIELGRARLFAALLEVFERLSPGLVVLVVEDLHHAGASTSAWLAFAVRRSQRLLVVATARSATFDALDGARIIRLVPLDEHAVGQLVGDARAEEVWARSGGNPLFAVALAEVPSGRFPETVREAVERMAADLGSAASTVRAAAVMGSDIDLDLLAEVLRLPAVEALGHLEAAVRAGLLEERREGFGFRHELVREALETGAGPARRALVHREVALAAQRRSPPDWLVVARHARLGGDRGLAVDAYVHASDAALARWDAGAAIGFLDAGLAVQPDAVAALIARSRVRMACLDLAGAESDAAAARSCDGGAAAFEVSAWVAYYQRRYDDAGAFADRGIELAVDGSVRSSCLAVAGRTSHGKGDLNAARAHFALIGTTSGGVGAVAEVWRAHLLVHEGRPRDALEALRPTLVDPAARTHPWAALHGQFARVMALGHLGRVREGLESCDRFDSAIVEAGQLGERFVGIAANLRGWLLRSIGRVSEAADHHERALGTVADAAGVSVTARSEAYWVARLDLIDGRLLVGDVEAAAVLLEAAAPLQHWQGTMGWHQRHRLALAQARVALAAGRRDEAAELAAQVRVDAEARGAGRYAVLAWAFGALADDRASPGELAGLPDTLAACASLEAWWLLGLLAERFDAAAWRTEASRSAARLVAEAGAHQDDARRLVERRFSGVWSS